MSRYVDLSERVTAQYYDAEYEEWTQETTTIAEILDSVCDDYTVLPSEQQERMRGRWVPVTNGRGGYECDQCHNYAPSYQDGVEWLSDFCPNCGADMRGEQDD